MPPPVRALSVLRALALVAPSMAGCAQPRRPVEYARPGASSGEQRPAPPQDSGAVVSGESPYAGACPPALPEGAAACATEERCAYQPYSRELLTRRAPAHGDTACECVRGRWACEQLSFVGPLPPPELA